MQPLAVPVTETVATMGEFVLFKAVKDGVLLIPEAAKPIEVLEFVQAKVPPEGILVKVLAGIISPGQA